MVFSQFIWVGLWPAINPNLVIFYVEIHFLIKILPYKVPLLSKSVQNYINLELKA